MTDTITTPDLERVVDGYLAAWNERDADRRAELVATFWDDAAMLADPPAVAEGHDAISGMAAALHDQFPGHRFVRTTGVDAHHGYLRFGWELVGPDGAVAIEGIDVGLVGADGRMSRVVGFFGDLPPRG